MKENKKRNRKNILYGMPSLLQQNGQLLFSPSWPQSRKLPNIPKNNCEKVEEESRQKNIGMKKLNKKRIGNPKCEHQNAEIYAKDICQKCYNKFYNKVSRKGKYVK